MMASSDAKNDAGLVRTLKSPVTTENSTSLFPAQKKIVVGCGFMESTRLPGGNTQNHIGQEIDSRGDRWSRTLVQDISEEYTRPDWSEWQRRLRVHLRGPLCSGP